jgi:hypothetical protein
VRRLSEKPGSPVQSQDTLTVRGEGHRCPHHGLCCAARPRRDAGRRDRGNYRPRPWPGKGRRIYGRDSERCPCCLRHPYRVTPRGLYTDSAVFTSNASSAVCNLIRVLVILDNGLHWALRRLYDSL